MLSQSLSGWDGVFHKIVGMSFLATATIVSQSLSGWDGVFHTEIQEEQETKRYRRNPFQGGMGFFTCLRPASEWAEQESQSLSGWDGVFHDLAIMWLGLMGILCRNPFQGGMGFFTHSVIPS